MEKSNIIDYLKMCLRLYKLNRNPGFDILCSVPYSVLFAHKTGVTIGPGVKLGENIVIYQGVTIGAIGINRDNELSVKGGYPTIEDNVIIYSYASVLGDITIGRNSVIGAYSLVLDDVPAFSIAVGIPAKVIKYIKKDDKELT